MEIRLTKYITTNYSKIIYTKNLDLYKYINKYKNFNLL